MEAPSTRDALNAAVVRAAIAWHVHHSPLTGAYDDSPLADRLRAEMRVDRVAKLHEAVAALLADIDREFNLAGATS